MMLGVDVGKAELHGTWRDPETRRIRLQGAVPNTEAGIRQLLRRSPGVSVVVESTGRYGEPLIRAAQAVGREMLAGHTPQGAGVPVVRAAAGEDRPDRQRRAGVAWSDRTAAAVVAPDSGGRLGEAVAGGIGPVTAAALA